MKEKEIQKNSVGHVILSVIGVFLIVIFVPVLIANIILIVKGYTNPEKVPGLAGYYPMIVLSGSMEDTIMTGDLIIGKYADISEVREGDIISFYDGDSIVTHRAIEIETVDGEISITTQGDANNTPDRNRVTKDTIIGIYHKCLPGLGDAAMFLQTTTGLVVCVILPVTLLLAYDVIRRSIYAKKEKEETDSLRAEIELLRAEKERLARKG